MSSRTDLQVVGSIFCEYGRLAWQRTYSRVSTGRCRCCSCVVRLLLQLPALVHLLTAPGMDVRPQLARYRSLLKASRSHPKPEGGPVPMGERRAGEKRCGSSAFHAMGLGVVLRAELLRCRRQARPRSLRRQRPTPSR